MSYWLSSTDFASISPLLILLAMAFVLLFLESFYDNLSKKIAGWFTACGLIVAIVAAFYAPDSNNVLLTAWLRLDQLARFLNIFFLLIGLGSTLLAISFFKKFSSSPGEYFFLLVSSLFGLILIGESADFLTLFLGLETLSIPLYILCGYMKQWHLSHESALKYFFIGAMATAFFLYGVALIYGAVGTTRFEELMIGYKTISSYEHYIIFLAGTAFITLGLCFKAAVVPFHVWAPDVYCGAPTPVTAFMAVGTKVGAFAAFVRVFVVTLPHFNPLWNELLALLAYPTMIYANIVALRQTQLRRFFAYSGISHAGFLLIPLAVGTEQALPALFFYMAVYSIATLGCFAVMAQLEKDDYGVVLGDLHGLAYRSPWLAAVMGISVLTLAGIPPTVGFFAKFYLFKIAFEAKFYGLVIVGLLTTILSAFYYLRIVSLMIASPSEKGETDVFSLPSLFVGALSVAALVAFSFFPTPLFDLIAQALL